MCLAAEWPEQKIEMPTNRERKASPETAREHKSPTSTSTNYYEYAIAMNGKNRVKSPHECSWQLNFVYGYERSLKRFVKDFRYVPFDSSRAVPSIPLLRRRVQWGRLGHPPAPRMGPISTTVMQCGTCSVWPDFRSLDFACSAV